MPTSVLPEPAVGWSHRLPSQLLLTLLFVSRSQSEESHPLPRDSTRTRHPPSRGEREAFFEIRVLPPLLRGAELQSRVLPRAVADRIPRLKVLTRGLLSFRPESVAAPSLPALRNSPPLKELGLLLVVEIVWAAGIEKCDGRDS